MKTLDTQSVLIDLQYLPSLEYFCHILPFDEVILEGNEHYVKQSYRNRCYLLGSNKTEMLVIPILHGNKKTLIKDVKIDYSQRWSINHWRTISAAYGKSPFFEYYSDYFIQVYEKKHKFLWEFNFDMLTICLKLLRVKKTISQTGNYEKNANLTVFDARSTINPKKDLNKASFYNPEPYQQNFGNEFVPNLSIIDLLFCRGNQALEILKKSSQN
jgi:hypothetical protein